MKSDFMEGFSLIIPAYNEEDAIRNIIDKCLIALNSLLKDYEIIVVNDGSTDRTAEIAKEKGIKLLSHSHNRGYGASLKTGIKEAKYNLIGIIDADDTYSLGDMERLLPKISECDMVVGARTGEIVNIPFFRRPAKWILGKLANILTGDKIPDLNSGLRVFKKDIVTKFLHILPEGFSFTATITIAMLSDGYKVDFIPINYHERTGKSKIRPLKNTYDFLMLIVRTVMYFDPLKIFLPISFFLGSIAVIHIVYDVIVKHVVTKSSLLVAITTVQVAAIGLIADLIVRLNKRLR